MRPPRGRKKPARGTEYPRADGSTTRKIAINFDQAEFDAIAAFAASRGLSFGETVRRLIETSAMRGQFAGSETPDA